MTDYEKIVELLTINNISFREGKIYGTSEFDMNVPYLVIWFDTGHIEFDANDMIDNIVTY